MRTASAFEVFCGGAALRHDGNATCLFPLQLDYTGPEALPRAHLFVLSLWVGPRALLLAALLLLKLLFSCRCSLSSHCRAPAAPPGACQQMVFY